MRFCQPHWDELKKAIADRSLSHLIAKDGRQAMDQTIRQIKGEADPKKDFDPLLNAHWAIVHNALEAGGLYIMFGDVCPLCELDKNVNKPGMNSKDWIAYAADEQLEYARQHNLLG